MEVNMNSREFFYQFGKTFYKIDSFYAEFAKKSGVKPNLMWILYALDDKQFHSQKEISKTWDIPLSTINTIIVDLEKNGYVALEQIPGMKRELQIILTSKGIEYSNKILKSIYKVEEMVFNSLNERVRINEDLNYLLEQLNQKNIGEENV